jgi:hypothetical protein
MKHDSLAGFAEKVTRKELFHITIKNKHSCYIVWKRYLFTFVSVVKVVCLLLAKKHKVDTSCEVEIISENENVLHAAI